MMGGLPTQDMTKHLGRLSTERLLELSHNAHAQADSFNRLVRLIDDELARRGMETLPSPRGGW